jgi:hypothetical protein
LLRVSAAIRGAGGGVCVLNGAMSGGCVGGGCVAGCVGRHWAGKCVCVGGGGGSARPASASPHARPRTAPLPPPSRHAGNHAGALTDRCQAASARVAEEDAVVSGAVASLERTVALAGGELSRFAATGLERDAALREPARGTYAAPAPVVGTRPYAEVLADMAADWQEESGWWPAVHYLPSPPPPPVSPLQRAPPVM